MNFNLEKDLSTDKLSVIKQVHLMSFFCLDIHQILPKSLIYGVLLYFCIIFIQLIRKPYFKRFNMV